MNAWFWKYISIGTYVRMREHMQCAYACERLASAYYANESWPNFRVVDESHPSTVDGEICSFATTFLWTLSCLSCHWKRYKEFFILYYSFCDRFFLFLLFFSVVLYFFFIFFYGISFFFDYFHFFFVFLLISFFSLLPINSAFFSLFLPIFLGFIFLFEYFFYFHYFLFSHSYS